MLWQDQGGQRLAIEVKLIDQITKLRNIFPHGGTGIGPPVSFWIDPHSTQEIVLNELQVSIEAQHLVIDVPAFSIGRNQQSRHAKTVAILVHFRRYNMIVKAAPIIPRQ